MEDIKNMSKEELLEYLEEISQQLDNIALDQIPIAISELQFFKEKYKKLELRNKELEKYKKYYATEVNLFNKYISKDKIRDRQMQREFELQQEYKDFEDDVEWNVYQKLLKGSE